MNSRKQNLIVGLETAIHALKNNTIHYEWNMQESCNCGVVAQAILGVTKKDLVSKTTGLFTKKVFKEFFGGNPERTWRNAVKIYCPITGKPMKQIFIELHNAGLTKEDIGHLEYMNNELILKRSGIKSNILKKIYIAIFSRKYYSKKENLIKYLSAWVQILKEETGTALSSDIEKMTIDDKDKLESIRINAVLEQKFELAAQVRDKINSL